MWVLQLCIECFVKKNSLGELRLGLGQLSRPPLGEWTEAGIEEALLFWFWMGAHQASLVAQMVKKLTANAGDPGLILGSGRSLEKEMATHSSILAWRIPWTEEPGGLRSMVLQKVRHDWATNTFIFFPLLASRLHLEVPQVPQTHDQHRISLSTWSLWENTRETHLRSPCSNLLS